MCGTAHDFNNLLFAILTFAELAKNSEPQKSKTHLQGITTATNLCQALVQQLLDFGGQREQEPKPVDLSVVTKEVLSLLRLSLPTTIEIDDEGAAHPRFVLANSIQLSQILMNLCLNGAQSMSTTGGVLEVSLADVKMDSERMQDYPDLASGSFVRLRVRDTGVGIPSHLIKRIFDPFFTTKESGEGTGMGLAVVWDIVTRHQGMISVESVLGQGTLFDIYLPKISEEFETQEVVEIPGAIGNECILFVDDERSICELVQENLTHLGYTIITQSSSQEALDIFLETPERFDLVITDLSMPKITGERLAQKLLNIRPDLPIILCTGRNQAFADEKVREIGIQGSVLKPFTESDVAHTIRRVLDRASEERSLKVIA